MQTSQCNFIPLTQHYVFWIVWWQSIFQSRRRNLPVVVQGRGSFEGWEEIRRCRVPWSWYDSSLHALLEFFFLQLDRYWWYKPIVITKLLFKRLGAYPTTPYICLLLRFQSSHIKNKPNTFWWPENFIDELDNLLDIWWFWASGPFVGGLVRYCPPILDTEALKD